MKKLGNYSIEALLIGLYVITQIQCEIPQDRHLIKSGSSRQNDRPEILCPSKCKCEPLQNTDLKSVSCIEVQLTEVPNVAPEIVGELNLKGNVIRTLNSASFRGYNRLKKLILENNEISSIDNDTFLNTNDLIELHLDHNKLNVNSSIGFFEHLVGLQILKIDHNIYINDAVFEGLTNLTSLTLSTFKNPVELGPSFLQLKKLQSMEIHGEFKNISNNSFKNFANSTIITLSIKSGSVNDRFGTLAHIEPNAFIMFSSLRTLDLSSNRGIGFSNTSMAFVNLKGTNITTLNLIGITPVNYDSQSFVLNENFYNNFGGTNITTLAIDRNDINTIKRGLAKAFPNLEKFSLSYNHLTSIEDLVMDVFNLKNLTDLDASYASKRYMERRSTDDEPKENSKTLNKNNKLNSMIFDNNNAYNLYCNTTSVGKGPCRLPFKPKTTHNCTSENLCLPEFQLRPISPDGPWCLMLPRRLESVNLTSIVTYKIRKLPKIAVLGSNKHLRELIFRANDIVDFQGPFVLANSGSSTPITIDIGDNGAYCFSPEIFHTSIERGANITRLILDGNNLGDHLDHDPDGLTFQYYLDLTEIDLSRNNIKALKIDSFKNLNKLQILNLSGNSLSEIQFNFTHMTDLKHLDLSYNLLADISSDVLENLQIILDMNVTLHLIGNPVQCTCQTLPFLRWLNFNSANIDTLEKIYCIMNQSHVFLDHLDDFILKQLEPECSSGLLLTICGVLFAITSLCILISICLYRHRWDIRYCLLNFKKGKGTYQKLLDGMRNYKYDAFVSYDSHDRRWVVEELIPNLENILEENDSTEEHVRPFRLCVHERDFLAGESIEENIVSRIKDSKKVLLLLTDNFLQSPWCRFEMEISQVVSFNRGWNILIPVMLEQISSSLTPESLQMLIRRQTYIDWKPQSPDREEFWTRLKGILSDTDGGPCMCQCERSYYQRNQDRESLILPDAAQSH